MEAPIHTLSVREWLKLKQKSRLNSKLSSRLKLAAVYAWLALPAGAALAQTPVQPPNPPALARKLNCMSCHAVDRTLLGPSFADIAGRYGDKTGAHDYLAQKIQTGGVGAWGSVPMPANTQVDDQQAHLLADWILQIKHSH